MRKLLLALLLIFPRFASAQGALLPDFPQQYSDALGVPVASGFVCLTISGTTTNLASYPTSADAVAGTNANANPVQLDSAGRASIFMGAGTYRAVLLNPVGIGSSSCNGTPTGSAIKTVDGISQFAAALTIAVLNNIRYCNAFPGATAGDKITAAILDLPSTGGTVDCRGLQGTQSLPASITFGKPVDLILGCATYNSTDTGSAAFVMYAGSIIEGQGRCSIIRKTVNGANADGIYGASFGHVQNLRLEGNTTFSSGAIAIEGGDDMTIGPGLEVDHWGGHGLNGASSNNWTVTGNYIHDNHDDGVLTNAGTSGHRIYHNHFTHNGSIGVDTNATNVLIEDNEIDNNGFNYTPSVDCHGIFVATSTSAIVNTRIIHNLVHENYCHNIVIQSGTTSFDITYTQVLGNEVYGGDPNHVAISEGIALDTSHPSCGSNNYALIEANQVHDTPGDGILIGGGSPAGTCHVQMSKITGNYVRASGATGIQVAFGNDAVVDQNTSLNNTTSALDISGSTNTSIQCNKIANGSVSAKCTYNTPLETNTIRPYSSAIVTLDSPGNTELDWTSSAGGGQRAYSWLIDQFGNFNLYDATAAATRLMINSSGNLVMTGNIEPANITVTGGIVITTSGPTITAANGAPGGGCTTGSLYLRKDGGAVSTLYVCETGAWAAK